MTVFCGIVLWKTPLGAPLINTSYDELFRFSSRTVTNKVAFIMMDNESFDALQQTRGQPWDRALHARLLDKLAADNCAVVVMDSFFAKPRDLQKDEALAHAMSGQRKIVLMAEQALVEHPDLHGVRPIVPAEPFFTASQTNWGVAWVNPDPDGVVRRHWPFPSPGPYPSLPETAAQAAGATLDESPRERWLRYYGQQPPWTRISYSLALKQSANFFRGKIVFIGTEPKTSLSDNEPDEFRTPYSRWTGESSAGTEIMITTFLNLMNDQSLRRSTWLEGIVLLVVGVVGGIAFSRFRTGVASRWGIVAASGALILSAGLTATSNYWFPWMLVVVGQLPVAIIWAYVCSRADPRQSNLSPLQLVPKVPGYRLIEPPFGSGAYGTVWLARSKRHEWRAVKVVSLEKFGNDTVPFDREYDGVNRYSQICDKHEALLRVEFVSEKFPKHFYYIMELGDADESGWEKSPVNYRPRDLARVCARSPQKRLPMSESVRIGLTLCDTLHFLHSAGLTHRDIKPENILYVNGEPKLADLGLITDIRPLSPQRTLVGTPGYMPPSPETPGTPEADIYALGMVLYVISTGRNPALFPEISATLLGENSPNDFLLLNKIILKACQPNPVHRFASATQMRSELQILRTRSDCIC